MISGTNTLGMSKRTNAYISTFNSRSEIQKRHKMEIFAQFYGNDYKGTLKVLTCSKLNFCFGIYNILNLVCLCTIKIVDYFLIFVEIYIFWYIVIFLPNRNTRSASVLADRLEQSLNKLYIIYTKYLYSETLGTGWWLWMKQTDSRCRIGFTRHASNVWLCYIWIPTYRYQCKYNCLYFV